ncbi:MAG: endolytic transglycosylase MltG [Actinobacteria bacterium HGW-Actinobacteria-10]|jgi:UPF0755 protein|nr:MAG: endolytic transglycosylase MltG [Actinobacteria bacterium HGW-Actinobacteria-10]
MVARRTAPRRSRTLRRALAIFILLIVLLVVGGLIAGWMLFLKPDHDIAPGRAVQVEIVPGMSTGQIAERLSRAGVVENANMFRLQVRLDGTGGQLKSGVYELSTAMEYEDVAEVLIAGPVYTYYTVTVPEGFVVEQIAARFEEKAGIPASEFLALAKGGASQFAGEHPYLSDAYQGSLEGFLFPKTYRVREGSTATEVISMMLDQFDREIADVDFSYPESRGMSVHSTIVLASMIEREVSVASERELVSSVIYNRLDKDMRLEIDATIEYVLPGNRFRLRASDIEIDSPYNTYRNKGLPPGAIANPGKAAIQAACSPAKTEYLYYVLTARDGSHTFATNHAEFLIAKRKSKEVFGQ